MKVFRDLFVRGSNETLTKTLETITEKIRSDAKWQRAEDLEQRHLTGGPRFYIFRRPTSDGTPSTFLYLVKHESGYLYVPNIVPTEPGELTYDQYNHIVEEFYELFVRPASKLTGAESNLSADQKSIEDWGTAKTIGTLRAFSHLANKSTGNLHPYDRERWLTFVVAVHNEEAPLRSSDLKRWFIEEEGWSEDVASTLASDYEYARELLRFYDSTR